MKIFSSFLIGIFLALTIFGQQTNSSREAELKAIENKAMGRDEVYNRNKQLFPTGESVNQNSNSNINELRKQLEIKVKNNEPSEPWVFTIDKEKLAALRSPNPNDLLKYQSFLAQKNTGILKLFPYLDCESKYTIKIDGKCDNAVFDSWSYSFLRKDYGGSKFFDVALKNRGVWVDSFLSQNIIVPLGNIDLDKVTLKIEEAKFLVEFTPEKKFRKAKEQFWKIGGTIQANGFKYGKAAAVVENETYLLRIIPYKLNTRAELKVLYGDMETSDEMSFVNLYYDKSRWDKIISFKIIRIDPDDSVTILWKELSSKKAPKIDFEKKDKLTDLKDK